MNHNPVKTVEFHRNHGHLFGLVLPNAFIAARDLQFERSRGCQARQQA